MSFKATLKVAGKELDVMDVTYKMHQEVDASGRPSSVMRGGKITMTVESSEDTDLFEWMCNNFERKDGTITFYKRESEAKLKELKFKEAYLTDFEESFHIMNSDPLLITFSISAKEISMGNSTHINEWV